MAWWGELAATVKARKGDADPPVDRYLAGCLARVAERLVDGASGSVPLAPAPLAGSLATLAAAFGLDPVDVELVVVAVAGALDDRIADAFALAAGSPSGWPSVATAARLAGHDPWAPEALDRLTGTAPLIRYGLAHVDEPLRPLSRRLLRLDDRVVQHLAGVSGPSPALLALQPPLVPADGPAAEQLAQGLAAGRWVCWVRERPRASGFAAAVAAARSLRLPVVAVDLQREQPERRAASVAAGLLEAALSGGLLVVGRVELPRDREVLDRCTDAPCPVVLVSREHWDPASSNLIPLAVEAPELMAAERLRIWRDTARRLGAEVPELSDLSAYRLTPEQIVVAAASASVQAGTQSLSLPELASAARSQGTARLERLARRVKPAASFEQLVLGPAQLHDVRAVINRYRTLELVRETWRVGGAHSSRGITAMFHGPSGTGKTLSAEVIAHELGVDLFVIDLSQVVDKYIGETEKNLERIFSEAESVNGVLLFDEADALFGKRSSVKDAHDRHANVEVAYLLERMERFDGVAILATNLRGNLDEAFIRRLDVVCDFRVPTEAERRLLWQLHLPPTLPLDDDVDLDVLARVVEETGGTIRNITLAAAHAAAAAGRPVCMADLVDASVHNHRKRGRLLEATAFAAAGSRLRSAGDISGGNQ